MNEYTVGMGAPELITAVLAVVGLVGGSLVTIGRWLVQRMMSDIDQRMSRIDAVAKEVQRVDDDFKRLLAELPKHYQMRDDAIREYTVINAKIDRLTEVLIDIRGALRAQPH